MEIKPTPTRDGFGEELAALAKTNDKIVVVSADLEDATRADYFKKTAPERFFSLGIAEQDMVSMAGGLARHAVRSRHRARSRRARGRRL